MGKQPDLHSALAAQRTIDAHPQAPKNPALVERFDKLASETRERFENLGIKPEEVEHAVRWARRSKP